MIIIKNIKYQFKNKFKINFSTNIKQGEKISIFGPNGSGKSTFINLIAGFTKINSGELIINNINYTKISSAYRPISIIFQENNLFYHLNVMQNIAIGINPKIKINKEEKNRIEKIADFLKLKKYLYFLPEELSVGQRKLVSIARVLLRKKPILLLDEPFSSIDFFTKKKIILLIIDFCKKNNITLIIVLHNFEEAKALTNRSFIIIKGKIYWDGDTLHLIKKYKSILNKY